MTKILVFIGSRANYGRLKKVIDEIDKSDKFTLQLMLGASFYNIDIDRNVDSRVQCLCSGDDNESMVISAATMLNRVALELVRLKPDLVFVHGDRFEVLPVALAAYYMNIPIAHTEGGEDSGCIDDGIRNMITAIAKYSFTTNGKARNRLIEQGKQYAWNVGSTGIDNLLDIQYEDTINEKYIIILHHVNTSKNEDITPLIDALSKITKYKKIWINPNIDAGTQEMLKLIHNQNNIMFLQDLPLDRYYSLLKNASVLIGNSSSFLKEAAFLGSPAVIVGDRQQNRIHDQNVIFSEMNSKKILAAIKKMIDTKFPRSTMFGDGTAAFKIVKILEGLFA